MKKPVKKKVSGRDEYRVLIEQAPVMIRRWNAAIECDYCNGRWLEFRGRAIEQEKGYGWREGVHPDDAPWCVETLSVPPSNRGSFEMEYRLLRFDGAYRRIYEQWVPVTDANGEAQGYISSAFDITDKPFTVQPAPPVPGKFVELCASCKKIREGDIWHTLEIYLERFTHFKFSHSICPECNERLYKNPKKNV